MVVGVTFPIDLNGPVKHLVKYVHRKVSHRFEPDANRRRKIIAMAQECATKLQIDDWNLVPWDPLYVTMDMLQILAASKECSTLEGATQVACLLGANDIVLRKSYHLEGLDEQGNVEKVGLAHLKKCHEALSAKIGNWSGESVLHVFVTLELDTNPFLRDYNASEDLIPEIEMEWKNTLDFVRNLNKVDGKSLQLRSNELFNSIFSIKNCMYDTFFVALMLRFGMSAVVNDDGLSVAHFQASYYVREYVAFLLQVLQSESHIGKTTNFAKLRSFHVANCSPPAYGKTAWDVFSASMKNRTIRTLPHTILMRRPATILDMDLIDVMRRTLDGRLRNVNGIQVSIADSLLGVKEVGKDTFSGRISRRKVQLLQCGQDYALVLPYLNTIILQLNDDRWVRDHDFEALQPCRGVEKCEGSIRRAATVLLAFDYPEMEEPVVNDVAYRIIYQHARKGELFSKNLRKKLLSVKKIKHRVDIRALEMRASEVFKDDEVMMAALTREMVHDVLMTRGYYKEESMATKDEGSKASRSLTHLTCDNEAYYDTFYRKCGMGTQNNIECVTGVPLLGLRTDCTLTRAGQLGGQEMRGVAVLRRYDGEKVVVWIPARKCRDNDDEVATGFIENRECIDGKVIEPSLITAIPNNGPLLNNFRLGGYCRFDIDIGAPPEKQRKKAAPSTQVEVDRIEVLLDELKMMNR